MALRVGVVGLTPHFNCSAGNSPGDVADATTRLDCVILSTILVLLPPTVPLMLESLLLPFLETVLSGVDVRSLVMLGEQDCLLDLSGTNSLVFNEAVEQKDGDEPLDGDDEVMGLDDKFLGLEDPVIVLLEVDDINDSVPRLKGPKDGEENDPGLEELNDGDDVVVGFIESMGACTTGLPDPTEAPLELEIDRAGSVVLKFGGGSRENPGIADGFQACVLVVGELPRVAGALLKVDELALLAEADRPGATCP